MQRIIYNQYRPGISRQRTLKKRMIKKYGCICMICGSVDHIEIHHIKRVADGGDHTDANCLLFCVSCHTHQHGGGK